MRTLLLSFFCLLLIVDAEAQNASVKKYSTPLAGTVILRDVEDKYNAEVYNLEMPEPDAMEEQLKLQEIKQEVSRQFPYNNAASKTTAISSVNNDTALPPVVAFGYIADSLTGIPPDNDMAISKGNQSISVLNSNIAILDGTTGKMSYRKGLKSFSLVVALNGTNDYRYDPKVIYDATADKFICIMLNGTDAANYIVVGFSQTNDPAGKWNFYKFKGDYGADTTWFDYPCIAITKDEFFFTGNKIHYNTSWQEGFKRSVIYQINKQSGYNADVTLNYQIWDSITYNGKTIRNLYPVKGGIGQLGPEQYFLSNRNFDVQNDSIFLIKMPDVIASNNKNLTVTMIKSPIMYGVPPDGRQPDTSVSLATNDGRILGAYAVDNQINFVSATVGSAGSSAIYHGVVADYKYNPRIEHAFIYRIDSLDFGYPNVTYVGNGKNGPQSLISFNYSVPHTYPGLGAILYDGYKYSNLVRVKTGDSSIKVLPQKQQRWGDYMGAQPDQNNNGTVWIEGIFGRKDKTYGNWMAKLGSPLAQIPLTHDALLYPNPTSQYLQFEFSLEGDHILSFIIYSTAGQKVDKILQQRCDDGRNRLQFNTSSLASGIYYIKAIDESGKTLMTHRFEKQ